MEKVVKLFFCIYLSIFLYHFKVMSLGDKEKCEYNESTFCAVMSLSQQTSLFTKNIPGKIQK
jgi:hypothetical protein